jgi:hypothetical protein
MLSSVLSSKRAIAVNIHIMRIYTRMKEMLLNNAELLLKVEQLEAELKAQGRSIEVVFDFLRKLQAQPAEPRSKIGFGR